MCFVKEKTAYEVFRSLVGSEMCIREMCTCVRVIVCVRVCTRVYGCVGVTWRYHRHHRVTQYNTRPRKATNTAQMNTA